MLLSATVKLRLADTRNRHSALGVIPMRLFGRHISKKRFRGLLVAGFTGVFVSVFIFMVCSTWIHILRVRRDISECNEAIAQKKSELSQLEQKKAYYESDEFFEDAVRNGGYVDEDETVFVVTN